VDETAGTVTCPAGITRPISARWNVTFGAACRSCPLRARCTTSKHGRALILHEHHELLRDARADWATQPALRENYRKHRPNVERVISQIASRGGRRLKLRYRGAARNNAWLKHRTAAPNLRNLISRGLTRTAPGRWPATQAKGQHCLLSPDASAKMASAGRATTLPARKGLAYCRKDGLVGALPAQDPSLFSALLAADAPRWMMGG
jgi:Transposase DDE domain